MTQAPTKADEALAALRADAERLDRGLPIEAPTAVAQTPPGGGEAKEGVSGSVGSDPKAASTETAPETDATQTAPKAETPAAEAPTPAPEKQAEDSGQADSATDTVPKPRAEKKAEALARTWENAERRHREAEAREISLASREQRLLAEEQRLAKLSEQTRTPEDPLPQHSFKDLADSLAGFIDEGDVKLAKQLAHSMAAKAAAQVRAASASADNPQFVAAWDNTRTQVIKANPELADSQSPLFTTANSLLSGEWGPFFKSHPTGVAAAVEVAKLQLQVGKASALTEQVRRLETENQTLRKKLRLDGTTAPASREAKPVDNSKLSPDEQLALLRRDAEALSR